MLRLDEKQQLLANRNNTKATCWMHSARQSWVHQSLLFYSFVCFVSTPHPHQLNILHTIHLYSSFLIFHWVPTAQVTDSLSLYVIFASVSVLTWAALLFWLDRDLRLEVMPMFSPFSKEWTTSSRKVIWTMDGSTFWGSSTWAHTPGSFDTRILENSNDIKWWTDANVNNIIRVFTLLCMYRSIARTEYLQTANQPLQVSFSLRVDTPKRPLTLRWLRFKHFWDWYHRWIYSIWFQCKSVTGRCQIHACFHWRLTGKVKLHSFCLCLLIADEIRWNVCKWLLF